MNKRLHGLWMRPHGREVISREHEIAAWFEADFERITYLGSGPFSGLAREAQLKVLELAAGKNPIV